MKSKYIDIGAFSPIHGTRISTGTNDSIIGFANAGYNFHIKPNASAQGLKRQSSSLQRTGSDLSPRSTNTPNPKILLHQSTSNLEKLKRRPNTNKSDSIVIVNKRVISKNASVTALNDPGISSCNSSLISGEFSQFITKGLVKEKKISPIDDSHSKISFNKTFINNNTGLPSNFALPNAKLKIKEYQDKITFLQERIAKLIVDEIWDEKVTQQLQTYTAQMRIALEKAYSKFLLFPDMEKDLMESLIQKENSFMKIIKLIKGNLFEHMTTNKNLNDKLQLLKDENKALKLKAREDRFSFLQTHDQPKSGEDIRHMLRDTVKQSEKNERVWTVEKQQMAFQIEKLTKEIEEFRNTHNFSDLNKQYESFQALTYAKVKEMEKEIDEKDVKVLKLEHILSKNTTTIKELRRDLEEITKKYNDLSEEYTTLKSQDDKRVDKEIKYREIAMMSAEDLSQSVAKCQVLSENLAKTKAKFLDAQHKLDVYKREQSEMVVINEAEFQEDSTLLNVIKEAFLNVKRSPTVNLRQEMQQLESSPTNDPNNRQDGINIEKYFLNKPTFYVFIQQEFEAERAKPNPGAEVETEEKPFSIDRESLSLLRAILDSKYNEMSFYEDYRQHSSFPDFVYSWLNSFSIDPIEKKVKVSNTDQNADIQQRRLNFYKFLLNPKINKIWDVVTFRDFLEERCGLDEVYFYLSCRYLLFQGPQLRYYSSCINPVHWVQFDKAEKLIDLVLKKLGQEQYTTVKYKLKDRAKKKGNKFFIDSGLLLRILLEFYRSEKKARVTVLQDTFNKVSVMGKGNKPHLNFEVFKQFIEINYSFASDLEKARLYREAYYLGNGKVDYESFFTAANVSNFFTASVKVLVFQNIPTLETNSLTKEETERLNEINTFVGDNYRSLFEFFENCKSFARMLGFESILSKIAGVEANLSKKLNSAYDESKGQGLYMVFNQFVQILLRVRNHYLFIYRNSAKNEKELAVKDIKGIEALMKTMGEYARLEQIDSMEKFYKAKTIQRYFRGKHSAWYGLIDEALRKVRASHGKESPF